ncbi:GrpB family protein [Streptomyces sp. NPDC102364]|uniref:GrpB family protein n=1 Tax=Streptomyces sp. NPDC102364 TaxID=3366161 RepID=UPI0038076E12
MPFPDESGPVAVLDHRQEWAAEFERLAGVLRAALGTQALSIDHVGSTAVPGLAAKDCVDIQVRVSAIDENVHTALLAAIGFRRRPEPWNRVEVSGGEECRKLVFAPPVGARRCNVHVREEGRPNSRFALLFRDYLSADEDARRAWGAFKQRLARSVPDLSDYGQIKAPATEVLMAAAEAWASRTGWHPAPAPAPRR